MAKVPWSARGQMEMARIGAQGAGPASERLPLLRNREQFVAPTLLDFSLLPYCCNPYNLALFETVAFYWGDAALTDRTLAHRLCSLYPGEVKRTLQFVFLASLTFATTYGVSTLVDGLFLGEVGSHGLPPTYLFSSVACLLFAVLTLRALTRFSAPQIFISFCLVGLFGLVIGAFALRQGLDKIPISFWYLYKIASYSFLVMMYTQLWSFIDHCYELDDAKRLYGLYNASSLLGAGAGSALVSLLVRWYSAAHIFAIFSLLLLAILVLAMTIRRHATGSAPQSEGLGLTQGQLIREMIRSPFVLCLLLFNTLMLFLEIITEYNYLTTLKESIASSSDTGALVAFIGQCRGCVFLAMTLFGLFLYSRMIQRFKLSRAIIIPPLYFLTLFVCWLFFDGVIIGVMGIVAVEGVLAGLEDNNFNLMVNSVPARLKAQLRVTAEQVLEPGAMLISSALLMLCQSSSKTLGLTLSLTALGVVFVLRATLPIAHTRAARVPIRDTALEASLPQHVA